MTVSQGIFVRALSVDPVTFDPLNERIWKNLFEGSFIILIKCLRILIQLQNCATGDRRAHFYAYVNTQMESGSQEGTFLAIPMDAGVHEYCHMCPNWTGFLLSINIGIKMSPPKVSMSRKGPEVGQGILDFVGFEI